MIINKKKEKQKCYIENCRGCDHGNVLPSEEVKGSYKDIIGGLAMVGIIIILCVILL